MYSASAFMCFFHKSFIIGVLATLFVTLSVVPSSTSQNTGQYPLCPRTGLLPLPTTQPFTRCLQANAYTCCSNCFDLQLGLEEVSVNFTAFTQALSPNISAAYAFPNVHVSCSKRKCRLWIQRSSGYKNIQLTHLFHTDKFVGPTHKQNGHSN